jgi:P27 family predicted phage terminase small subunit
MTRGRKPLPARLRLISGNASHRPIKNEPKPQNKKPRAPKWLIGEGKTAFKRICRELDEMGLLTTADVDIISCLALTIGDLIACQMKFRETGSEILIPGRADTAVLNPTLRLQNRLIATISKLAGQLALSPESRSRIDFPEPEEQSLRDELMADLHQ